MVQTIIQEFFAHRQQQLAATVRLFALVDGLLYGERAYPLQRSRAAIALFDGTPDASLADAGPWLIDCDRVDASTRNALAAQAAGSTGVSWLISAYPLDALATELRPRLDAKMPDGRTALLRYYDARIMHDIALLMTSTQRMQFFVVTFDWLVEIDGRLARVHPHA